MKTDNKIDSQTIGLRSIIIIGILVAGALSATSQTAAAEVKLPQSKKKVSVAPMKTDALRQLTVTGVIEGTPPQYRVAITGLPEGMAVAEAQVSVKLAKTLVYKGKVTNKSLINFQSPVRDLARLPATVRLTFSPQTLFRIPLQAVVARNGDNPAIFLERGGVCDRVPIQVIEFSSAHVLASLPMPTADKRLIVRGLTDLNHADLVEVIP